MGPHQTRYPFRIDVMATIEKFNGHPRFTVRVIEVVCNSTHHRNEGNLNELGWCRSCSYSSLPVVERLA